MIVWIFVCVLNFFVEKRRNSSSYLLKCGTAHMQWFINMRHTAWRTGNVMNWYVSEFLAYDVWNHLSFSLQLMACAATWSLQLEDSPKCQEDGQRKYISIRISRKDRFISMFNDIEHAWQNESKWVLRGHGWGRIFCSRIWALSLEFLGPGDEDKWYVSIDAKVIPPAKGQRMMRKTSPTKAGGSSRRSPPLWRVFRRQMLRTTAICKMVRQARRAKCQFRRCVRVAWREVGAAERNNEGGWGQARVWDRWIVHNAMEKTKNVVGKEGTRGNRTEGTKKKELTGKVGGWLIKEPSRSSAKGFCFLRIIDGTPVKISSLGTWGKRRRRWITRSVLAVQTLCLHTITLTSSTSWRAADKATIDRSINVMKVWKCCIFGGVDALHRPIWPQNLIINMLCLPSDRGTNMAMRLADLV